MSKPEERVFRKVDGKLVPIPGNKRDPNRRYGSVGSKDGGYHVEYTDEEEQERDEEERKWEAEKPLREAERTRQEKDAKKFRDSLIYENRIVAFIDILGWKNAIIESNNNPELATELGLALSVFDMHKKMTEWKEKRASEQGWSGGWLGDPQITHFSDSILFSIKFDKHATSEMSLFLWSITSYFLGKNFLLRGGIAAGKLIHKNSIVYGPALIDAYKLERDVTGHPRIILSDTLSYAWGRGDGVSFQDGTFIGHVKTWRKDTDGKRFYDFLQPFPNIPSIEVNISTYSKNLEPIRKLIISRLEKHPTVDHELKIHEKFKWLARYFNEITEEYPGCGEKIL
jgi:hypothetical protein